VRTVPGRTDTVVVIGAGLGGLACALHLAGAGRSVTVLEREAVPGGRAGTVSDAGYTFDTGPTVLTMPELLERAFAAVGEQLADRLSVHRLEPAYRARFTDGSSIDVLTDTDAMADQIAATCGGADAEGYRRLVAYLRELYRLELPHFIDRNLDSPLDLLGVPLARLAALGGFGRLGPKIAGFVRDERLRRIFSFQALYAGLSPARALALYAVITYMDCVGGVYFPQGGMHAVPRALAAAAEAHGVTIRYRTPAARVEITGGRARAVITTAGERIPADAVVINADLPGAYRELLPGVRTPRRVRRLRYSPSAVVLHAGSRARYDHLAHHTIEFGDAWSDAFDAIIDRGELMPDPSFLMSTPTRTDPSLAPAGRHCYYLLFPAPNLAPRHGRAIDWTGERARYRARIGQVLHARGYSGFDEALECERLVTPADWAAQGLSAGTPFAAAHRFGQTGPFRPSTLHPHVENLVFAGAHTQPGVGVPMVLVSGHLAAQRITGPMRR
jgi:phytoene desaturase